MAKVAIFERISGNDYRAIAYIDAPTKPDLGIEGPVEVPFIFSDDPALNDSERSKLIDVYADRAIKDYQDEFTAKYKFYGYTQG